MINIFRKPGKKELDRILAIPRRNPDKKAEEAQPILNELLQKEKGTMQLRPYQSLAVLEVYENHGALLFFSVGTGKTLISYLICSFIEILDDTQIRGCLLVPARLIDKTNQDFYSFKTQWQTPSNLVIVSYEKISRDPNLLDKLKPEIIIADECHKLSNKRSAVTRRVERYLRKNGETWFVGMSGTLVKRSIKDWWHLLQYALPYENQVLPIEYAEIEAWCGALDEKPRYKVALGALKKLATTRKGVLQKLGERFSTTSGIIMCEKVNELPNLKIEYIHFEIPEITETADVVRDLWETPSGTEFMLALDLYRHLREISQGFCYEWIERPPLKWLNARREFSSFVRSILGNSRSLDTMMQIVEAFKLDPIIKRWKEIEPTFKLRSRAEWFTYEYFRKISYLVQKRTLLWVSHKTVGKYLEKKSNYMFYTENGENKNGESINDCKSDVAIVSTQSISEGFNLQRFTRNVILCPPKQGRKWEQLLGRTHRTGQTKDVEAYVCGTLPENREDFEQAILDAQYIQNKTGNKQKLVEYGYE